jgi:DNA invertase Pin-like site-specific DNA recombinase
MGNHKRKSNRQLKFAQELSDDIKRRQEDGKSGRQIALLTGITESTSQKRLEAISYVGYFEINL